MCNQKLEAGEKELHIVAPPGAGKTIIGLEIISQFKCPALVLTPNTTIQAQWSQKLDHFLPPTDLELARSELVGTHNDKPLKPITVMTYQALSVPGKEKEYLESLAVKEWIKEIQTNLAPSRKDAEIRLLDLQQNNPSEYKKELRRHVSRIRRNLVDVLNLDEVLHDNALNLMHALKRRDIGLVIFDECHHLTDYWAAVMIHLVRRLDDVIIVGLTGTPPESKSGKQKNRYLNLVGEIDYQVPTPALVKEGGLAPYQDLVYFTEPEEIELQFLTECHQDFHQLLHDLTIENTNSSKPDAIPKAESRLSNYITESLESRWEELIEKKPVLAVAMSRYLWSNKLPLAKNVLTSDSIRQAPLIDDWIDILEDFSLNVLKVSSLESDRELYNRIKSAVKKIGYSLTERGIRRVASPVDRVLAYSVSKSKAVAKILETEYSYLDDRLRCVVVSDFEKMSATSAKPLKGILDSEAGGTTGILKELLNFEIADIINPSMVTGSRLLIDRRIKELFVLRSQEYLDQTCGNSELVVECKDIENMPFSEVFAASSQWTPRVYVDMVTLLFESGITKCLIGTRGILGEGWDCQALNTIVDLTTTTSTVSVKQLRGRGIRLLADDPLDPMSDKKVANNWDVVSIAPSLEKGLNDYYRFVKKHDGYFGISDDGQIECGVGHVHPSFSDLTPSEVFADLDKYNNEMCQRAIRRLDAYELWKVGESYENEERLCVELCRVEEVESHPLCLKGHMNYQEHLNDIRKSLNTIWVVNACWGGALSIALIFCCLLFTWSVLLAALPFSAALLVAFKNRQEYLEKLKDDINKSDNQETVYRKIGAALLDALKERRFLPESVEIDSLSITKRSDNSYRIFLDNVEVEHSNLFIECFEELIAPVTNQQYLLPRYYFELSGETLLLEDYLKGNASPEIGSFHAIPKILARSKAGREALEFSWNMHVSPGFITTFEESARQMKEHFGIGPRLVVRKLWG